MKELARSYIEKRIQKARTQYCGELAAKGVKHHGNDPAGCARIKARDGDPSFTASYLHLDDSLPILQKGQILMDAYVKSAHISAILAKSREVPRDKKILYEKDSQGSYRISQNIWRAVRRIGKS